MSSQPTAATSGRRFSALAADWLIAYLSSGLVARASYQERSILNLALFFIEIALMTALTGSSIGQRMTNLKVVDEYSGLNLPVGRVLLRTLLIVLVLPAVFTHNGRHFHDVICRSRVIHAESKAKR